MKNKKILITGHNGFIGSALAKKYSKNNFIYGIDKIDKPNKYINQSSNINLMNSIGLYEICSEHKFDYIFHCASPVGVEYILNNPCDTTEEALFINLNIHTMCRNFGITLVFFSTSEIYGNNSEINTTSLSSIPNLTNGLRGGYAAQKLVSEFLFCNDYYRTLNIRLFNITGPNQNINKGVISKLIYQVMNKEDITINAISNRVFLYIDDMVNIFNNELKNFNKNKKQYDLVLIGDKTNDNCISIKFLLLDILEKFNYTMENYPGKLNIELKYDGLINRSFSYPELDNNLPKIKSIDFIIDKIIKKLKNKG